MDLNLQVVRPMATASISPCASLFLVCLLPTPSHPLSYYLSSYLVIITSVFFHRFITFWNCYYMIWNKLIYSLWAARHIHTWCSRNHFMLRELMGWTIRKARLREVALRPLLLGYTSSDCPSGPYGAQVALSLTDILFPSVCSLGTALACQALCLPWLLTLCQRTQWQLRCECCVNDWLGPSLAAYFQTQAVNASLIEAPEAIWVSFFQGGRHGQVSHHQSSDIRGKN